LSDEEEIVKPATEPKWVKMLNLLGFVVSLGLIVLTLKPYHKAYKLTDSSLYTVNDQTDSNAGYVVDYSGVVDFVASEDKSAQAELLMRKSGRYKLSLTRKYPFENSVVLYLNGVEENSFTVDNNRQIKTIKIRKNDYLKLKVSSVDGSEPQIGLKIEIDNSKNQRRIYGIIFLWFIIGIWLYRATKSIHLLLPSALLAMGCYNEHLYPQETWFSPMVGFIAIIAFITLVRFFLSKTGLRVVTRMLLLAYDILLVIVGLVLAGFIFNYKRYGYKTDYDSIVAVLQSNFAETIEFAFGELPIMPLIGVVAYLSLPFLIFFFTKNNSSLKVTKNHLLALVISGTVGLSLISESQFVSQFKSAYNQYYEEIDKFNEVQKRFKEHNNIEASKSETGETYIFVIGESQSKEHMSVYGYHRPTTPFLDSMNRAKQLSLFTGAYSSHTHTIMVLRDALTQSNQYNGLHYTQVPSLINVLNASDFETVWLSNQVKLSNWDNIVSAIADACDEQVYLNKNIGESMRNSPHDDVLLPELKRLLSINSKKNRAVFIHVLGNHGQYQERFPAGFKGIPSRGLADFGGDKDIKVWEAYDNSILYSDYILRQIHQIVEDAPGEIKLLTYFADHAEDLSEGRGHNSGQFTYRMTQIPMYVWANEGYKERYKNKWNRVKERKNNLFSNDLFFQLAIDLTQVETPLFNSTHDVINPLYRIDTFKTKSGGILYDNPENAYTNGKTNAAWMLWHLGRIGIHRVNSLGKLNEVQLNKMKSIELDVKVVDGILMVGHGETGAMSGISLMEYLSNVNLDDMFQVWLDIKNIDPTNLQDVIVGLDEVAQYYPKIKSKLIVETQSKDYNISLICQKGYNTSYYLPSNIAELSESEQMQKALVISKQLKYQKVGSISFDAQLYGFVKDKLEPRISPVLDYHTWDLEISARNGRLKDRLTGAEYYSDNRVKTILVSFPSVFDL
jgi:heptose-I-phosphate ethanolaminephosphotransferase